MQSVLTSALKLFWFELRIPTYTVKKILFIINNQSGTALEKRVSHWLKKALDQRIFSYDYCISQFPKQGIALARDAASQNIDIVVAVGGDGTVNDVANGIFGTDTILGILPAGSGNGLARSLGIPINIRKSLLVLNQMNIRTIDSGWANGHLFLSNAGVGFDAFIARKFASNKGRGILNYTQLVIRSFGKFKPAHYVLEVDGIQYKETAFFISVANSNQIGYGFKMAPEACLDDSKLDIIVMHPLRFWQLAPVTWLSITGHIQNSKFVKHLKGSRIRVTSSDPLNWMQVDGDAGEIRDKQEFEVEIFPQSMRVIVP